MRRRELQGFETGEESGGVAVAANDCDNRGLFLCFDMVIARTLAAAFDLIVIIAIASSSSVGIRVNSPVLHAV